ncbi:MAG TPA: YitT family protein [Paenibacillus sp.]
MKILSASLESAHRPYKEDSFKRWCIKLLFVIAGSILASVGLELFLIPNQIIVGGMTGISALFAHVTEMRLGLFLFLFNVPFMLMAYRHIRREFVILAVLGLAVFSFTAIFLHPIPALIEHPVSAAICGGISLGLGIGIVVRFGGMLDTLEMADRSLARVRIPLSLDNLIMVINCVVLTAAGVIFGWNQAMYSIIAYLLAFEMVHITLRGFSLHRMTYVVSNRHEEIAEALSMRLRLESIQEDDMTERHHEQVKIGNTMIYDVSGLPRSLVYKVHILEQAQFRGIVRAIDPDVRISNVTDRTINAVRD